MKLTACFPFFLLLLLGSCFANPEKEADSRKGTAESDWEVLEIIISNDQMRERVGIFNDNDTCRYSKIIRDTSYFKKHGSFPGESRKFTVTKQEKLKIYGYFKDIIEHRVPATEKVSCYAGDYVSFKIGGNPEVACHYSSVDNWQTISPSIKGLYHLTIKKVHNRQ